MNDEVSQRGTSERLERQREGTETAGSWISRGIKAAPARDTTETLRNAQTSSFIALAPSPARVTQGLSPARASCHGGLQASPQTRVSRTPGRKGLGGKQARVSTPITEASHLRQNRVLFCFVLVSTSKTFSLNL